ncbi:MAG TPA: hypothetical protein VIA61_19955 [Methylomirabilota bacterium]|jgi:hypothetical protein
MRLPVSIITSVALVTVLGAPASQAQQRCADVESAKMALKSGPATRQPLASRSEEVQAPRGQDVQAPRGQEVQAPRGQETQAPRGQDVQAPRGQAAQLVKEAEAACSSGNTALASEKARAAMALIGR